MTIPGYKDYVVQVSMSSWWELDVRAENEELAKEVAKETAFVQSQEAALEMEQEYYDYTILGIQEISEETDEG